MQTGNTALSSEKGHHLSETLPALSRGRATSTAGIRDRPLKTK